MLEDACADTSPMAKSWCFGEPLSPLVTAANGNAVYADLLLDSCEVFVNNWIFFFFYKKK